MLFILKVLEGAVQSTMGAYQQDRSRPPLAHFAPPLDLSSVFNSSCPAPSIWAPVLTAPSAQTLFPSLPTWLHAIT